MFLNEFSLQEHLIFNAFTRCLALKESFTTNPVENCFHVDKNYGIYFFLEMVDNVPWWIYGLPQCAVKKLLILVLKGTIYESMSLRQAAMGTLSFTKTSTWKMPCQKSCLGAVLQWEGHCWALLRALCGQRPFLNDRRFGLPCCCPHIKVSPRQFMNWWFAFSYIL